MRSKGDKSPLANKATSIKFVHKAKMWCKTTWDERGKQEQEWSILKPMVVNTK